MAVNTPGLWFVDLVFFARAGVHDFAGSGAVSLLGAMNGLIGVSMLGPRLGRFDDSRRQEVFFHIPCITFDEFPTNIFRLFCTNILLNVFILLVFTHF